MHLLSDIDNGSDWQQSHLLRVCPESPDQLIQLLKAGSDIPRVIVPRGTNSRLIHPPETDRLLLELNLSIINKLNKFVPADFYVNCQAGMALSSLWQLLAENRLVFPFLQPTCKGTIGGMVSTGQLISPDSCYNISRWVLALTVIMGDATVIKTGAVTFKSVAGYDLPKLFCGSFGSLGVIVDATLRCFPETGKPFGKDVENVAVRIPRLSDSDSQITPSNKTDLIVQRIKQAFDPDGIFPSIAGWNSELTGSYKT